MGEDNRDDIIMEEILEEARRLRESQNQQSDFSKADRSDENQTAAQTVSQQEQQPMTQRTTMPRVSLPRAAEQNDNTSQTMERDTAAAEDRAMAEGTTMAEGIAMAERISAAKKEIRNQRGGESLPEQSAQIEDNGKKAGKKKKKGGLFGRKQKKMPDFDDGEDLYYGIQLKPIDEYSKGYDAVTGEFTLGEDAFTSLFDDSKKAIDDEVEKNFDKLQQERRRRVAEAVQNAGMDVDDVADEFGIVAPMPVSAVTAEPIQAVNTSKDVEDTSDFHQAMLETSSDKSMELKLNVLNDTVEVQRVKDAPVVSEESVNKILDMAEEIAMAEETALAEEMKEADETAEEKLSDSEIADPDKNAKSLEVDAPAISREIGETPQVATIYEYRQRGIPVHVINADVLQSALLSESQSIENSGEFSNSVPAPFIRTKQKRRPSAENDTEQSFADEQTNEDIDDYTGPADASSIIHELRNDMRELTLRMAGTGVSTIALAIINMIYGSRFSVGGNLGASPVVYIILTLIILAVLVAVCYKSVLNGLRALMQLNPSSDSGMAVAAVAVTLQTVSSLFYSADVGAVRVHLYAAILGVIMFMNTAGKLSMTRRIHSNFRFVTSSEQKYSVELYDDYNTALKMTKNCVAEKPVIAYQKKTNFLKKFLELSYQPDPAEISSQVMAPIALICSLVLCIVTLIITKNVPMALSAFTACACATVAVSNMVALNIPIGRLAKKARRAGAFVIGHAGVDKMGDVNAVMIDADELFPLGTVILEGIKPMSDRDMLESSVMSASALMNEIGGPLAGVFEQVINEREGDLPKVENIGFEEGGVYGDVDGSRIYIGNRNILISHKIVPPTRDEEVEFAIGNKQVVYIAVENKIAAMMIVAYTADRRRRNELQRMEDNGVSVVVRSTDVNITPQLVSRLFGIDVASVGVFSDSLGDVYTELVRNNNHRDDAVVATKGRIESMMNVISGCVHEKRNTNIIVTLQNTAIILGFILVAFMACFGAMKQMNPFVLFIFELFWMALIFFIPKVRKP